jgi:hypothetical protein
MKNFLQGACFIAVILPLIDGLTTLFSYLVQYLSTCLAVAAKNKAATCESEAEPYETSVIGFQMPDDEEYYEDDEEEEE